HDDLHLFNHSGHLQFYTFQSTYIILQFGMIYYLRVLHVQQQQQQQQQQQKQYIFHHVPHQPDISTLIRRALASVVTLWLINLRLCEFVNDIGSKSIYPYV
ncbi:hypothetical protein BGZ65_002798, partial [Modicella reniformis]